jgi:hypothetical protein
LDGDTCILAAGTHVDDIIAAGTSGELVALDCFLEEVFHVGARSKASDKDGFLYRGIRIKKPEPHHITMDMREYELREIIPIHNAKFPKRITQKIKDVLLFDDGQVWYRAAVGKLIWISCQCRPDISCMVSQASSVLGKAMISDGIFINKIIDHVNAVPITIHYYQLAPLSVPRRLRAGCDAAFKRKDERDDRARGGMLLCVGTRESNLIGLLNHSTAKIHRVCKSPTGAEAITISATGDQIDNTYNIFFWFYPTADPQGEILTDAFSVTSSQYKYCTEVTPNLAVDFALIRGRTRDGMLQMRHQLGEFMAADGMTKASNVAQSVLLKFLGDNMLGNTGVEMSKVKKGVQAKLQKAYACGKMCERNLTPKYLDNLAGAVNCEINGILWKGRCYEDNQYTFLVTSVKTSKNSSINVKTWTPSGSQLLKEDGLTRVVVPVASDARAIYRQYRQRHPNWGERPPGRDGPGRLPPPNHRWIPPQNLPRQLLWCCHLDCGMECYEEQRCDGCLQTNRPHVVCAQHAIHLGGYRFCTHCQHRALEVIMYNQPTPSHQPEPFLERFYTPTGQFF